MGTDYHIEKMISQPVSGPRSPNSEEDIRSRRTPHDVRLAKAVKETGWPLLKTWEAAPLKAGSVIIYSHNLFHRGNHRRDAHDCGDLLEREAAVHEKTPQPARRPIDPTAHTT